MKRLMSLCLAGLVTGSLSLLGCNDDSDMTKEEVKNLGDKADQSVDYCEEFGWYGDGTCDQDMIDDGLCLGPDPDCTEPECGGADYKLCEDQDTYCQVADNRDDQSSGECVPFGQTCGGWAQAVCPSGQWCDQSSMAKDKGGYCLPIGGCATSDDCDKQLDMNLITKPCDGQWACMAGLCKVPDCTEQATCGGPDYKLCEDQDTYCQLEDDRNNQSNGVCVPFGQACGGWFPQICVQEGQWCDISEMARDKGGYCFPIGGCATSDECDEQVELDLITKPCDGQWACMAGLCEMPDCNQDTCIDISGIWVFTEHCMEELKDEVANIEQTTCDITLSHNGNELFTGHVSEENRVTLISDDIACGATLSNNNTVLTSDCNGCDIVLTKQDI